MADSLNYDQAPDYLRSADLHNIGSGNESIFSNPVDYVASMPGKVAKFGISSIASGINSIYNTGVGVANWFGADAKENDVGATLSGIDSNLGQYYEENKQAADVAGFIATSFIPGVGGVKLFNAGQKVLKAAQGTGFIGETLATATGLIPTIEQSVVSAGTALAKNQQQFSLLNANVLKAVGDGFKQATWESIAFESAVAATMYKSPVLEGNDYKDVAANIVTGALLGGVIGGAINSAVSYGKIKNVIKAADVEQKPYTLRSSTAFVQNPADRILLAANDLAATPLVDEAVKSGMEAARTGRVSAIYNDIRSNVNTLAGDDKELGNVVADTLQSMMPDQIANTMNGASKLFRPGKNIKIGEDETIGWVKLWGDDHGNVSFDEPQITSLADRFKSPEEIQKFVDSRNFNRTKDWNMYLAPDAETIQARYMWAKNAKIQEGQVIDHTDIPLLERALDSGVGSIRVDDGFTVYTVDRANLYNEILQAKREVAGELGKAGKAKWIQDITSKDGRPITTDDIARAVNVSRDFLENTETASAFMRQDTQKQFAEWRKSIGLKGDVDLDFIPSHFGVAYKTGPKIFSPPDNFTPSALLNIKYQQKVSQDAVNNAFIGISGPELYGQVTHLTERQMIETNRFGAGAGLFSFSNGSYGSAASAMEQNGKVTANLIKKLTTDTEAVTTAPALALRSNQQAAIEFANINEQAARASGVDFYVMNEAGDGLILRKLKAANEAGEEYAVPDGVAGEIKFSTPEIGDAVAARIERNGARVSQRGMLANAQGLETSLDPHVFYPMKPDPAKMPFFAFVKDESLVGAAQGHTSMIHAATDKELQEMIAAIRNNEQTSKFTVYTKSDTEAFFKARQEYEFDRTLHENYIDSSLKSAGVNSRFFPRTDPNVIVDDWLTHEAKQDANLAREAMTTKLANEFDQFRTLGQAYTNVSSSRYGVTAKSVEAASENPYLDYAKTALNISRLSEYPILTSLNRTIENAIGKVYSSVTNAWKQASFTDKDLENVNASLERAGISTAYKSAAEVLLANHTAPKPVLSNFIRTANSILANTFLRTDPLNALNNAIGANVLLSHETSSLIKGIKSADPALAGELSKLLEIGVPGVEDVIKSPTKLIASVMKDYVSGDTELAAYVKRNGWSGRTGDMYRSMLEDLTVAGNESAGQLTSKLQSAFAKGQAVTDKLSVATGNQLAEDFNRFVAAGVAKKISDLGIKAGLLDETSQLSYINTFVNRTQGNILASQRPLIFQGPIGQAIGLFQTFQFNTMQQLFRGIAEGGPKDAAMLLGMQGTMYGLNGLPAFQYINQHIVGTASGNKDHTDAYSLTYGALGKTAGDWLMYGIPSNLLQTNIYSRGDINPRRITVIPTNPADIVAVSAFGSFLGNMKEMFTKMAGGAQVWQTMLQGIEHNTLSRPLAGMAQTLQAASNPTHQVFSTRNDGSISFVNDFLSLATLSRLAGGKPLDEALANDEIGRSIAYKANDKDKLKAANEIFRTHIIGGQEATDDAMGKYLRDFVDAGGRQKDFNKHMLNVLTRVDTPRANEVIRALKNPYAQRMQALMGGSVSGFKLDEYEE